MKYKFNTLKYVKIINDARYAHLIKVIYNYHQVDTLVTNVRLFSNFNWIQAIKL